MKLLPVIVASFWLPAGDRLLAIEGIGSANVGMLSGSPSFTTVSISSCHEGERFCKALADKAEQDCLKGNPGTDKCPPQPIPPKPKWLCDQAWGQVYAFCMKKAFVPTGPTIH